MSRFTWAPSAYRLLNGVLCVYKPAEVPARKVVETVKLNLARELNALPCYQHEIPLGQAGVTENISVKDVSKETQTEAIVDWSEHRLVLGNRYEKTDFKIQFVDGISANTSGIFLMGIGKFGMESVNMIAQSKFLRVYHVKGRLGWATDNFTPVGHIIERTSFKHVSRPKLDKVCAAAQANHTRQMYRLHGVNPDSQEAYEMAAQGLIRPSARKSEPVLYGVKCIDFQPPDFTLEIHCINETCQYLRCLVHELALKLKTTAVCSGIRRLRYGFFDTQRALISRQWHLDHIVDNIDSNMDLLTPDRMFVGTQAEKVELLPPDHSAGYLPEDQLMIDHGQDLLEDSALTTGPDCVLENGQFKKK
ncbi:unnamed protein product [Candidula unifasciata]|uniref:Pseudouridine synthase II N-terminal domain-containing protein n=1 Tax=Candidula unifasciata TaxID=100452 RepID=A0A8S3ZEJ4_9EUPU|nr:unnamed protein product [Candidula unifasciata]